MGTPNTKEVFSMKMTEKIKKEIRSRFKLLEQNYELMDYVRKEFFSGGRIFKSEPVRFTKNSTSAHGILYWLSDEEMQLVKEIEDKYNIIIYTAIFNRTTFGDIYSFLYISSDPEEWEDDKTDIIEGNPYVYAANITDSRCSEFGRIGLTGSGGGLLRTA